MAIEKRKIENLKPGKKYALNVKVKNTDLNIVSDLSDTIIFTVPTDTTIPSALTNLELFAGLENVMFVFDYSEDLDIRKYEYELYQNSDMSDETGPRTGFADANIFTVSVNNLQSEEDGGGLARFWGRARAIDTTGNAGPWTSLVETDDRIPVIDNQYIGSLTASKITAGTISSHTITLNSASSIIKSSNFDGTPVGDGTYNSATTGWLINGQGKAYFYDATVVGSIDVGGFDVSSFHVNTYGDMWLGAGTFGAAPFRVSRAGVLEIGAGTGSTIGGQLIDSIAEAVIDFNGRNNRNSTSPTAPTLPSPVTVGNLVVGASYTIVTPGNTSFTSIGAANDTVGTVFTATGVGTGTGTVSGETIDHTLNTDGSANISFEWNYTYSSADNAPNNIDGFYVHVYSSTSSDPYTFGTTPNLEATYPVDYLQRAVIFSGFPADKYYTFGVKAFRVVDKDIAAAGILYSSMVKSTVTQENPYRPSANVNYTGNIGGTLASTIVAFANAGNTVATNFNANNDRNALVPTSPVIVSNGTAIDHVINTDGSADISLEWTYTTSDTSSAANNIDGFIVYVRSTPISGATPSSYTFGSSPSEETTYYLPREKRAFILPGVAANRNYNFAVSAYRMVDTDVATPGIIYSPIIQSTYGGELFYQPSTTVAFAGNVTGTIDNVDVATLIARADAGYTVATNFNTDNDSNGLTPTSPVIVSNGTAIDHTINTDGSADISFEWTYTTIDTYNVANNIDGFIVYVRSTPISGATPSSYTFGSSPSEETTYYLPREKRAFILPGVAANRNYNFAVRAYRMVNTNVASPGIVYSPIIQSTYGGELFYQPSTTVAFAGNVTGTIDNIPVATLIDYADAGNTVAINFNTDNDSNGLTPTSPVIVSNGTAIDHTINTDGSADISFEWTYTHSDTYSVANNIDGFIVYVRSTDITGATPSSSYVFGSEPSKETTYYLPREKRAFILPGVAANRNYNFAVSAYRMVNSNVATPGIVYSPIIQSTYSNELYYQPSTTVAFAGNIIGTIDGLAATIIRDGTNNFNDNNDRIPTFPATSTSVAFSSDIINLNPTIDLPLIWDYENNPISITGASYGIYGATNYNTSTPHGFTTGNTVEVTGITPSSFDRTATVNVVNSTEFYFSSFNGNPKSALAQVTTTFTASGTSVSAAATYTGVTQSATNGSGSGAVFTITKTGSGTAYSEFITVTPVRTNLSLNPSFETNINNWASAQTGNVRSTDFAYTGVASMKITCNTTDSNIAYTTPIASATGNHTFSMYVYIPTGSSLAGRTVSIDREGGTATVSAVSQSNATLVAGSWVRLSTIKNVTVTGTLVLVARLSGSMSAVLPRTNLIPNPSFETNTTSWSPYQSSLTRVAGTIAGGVGSFSATSVASGTGAYGPYFQYSTPTVGSTLTVSAFCLRTVGTRTYRWDMQFYNGGTLISVVSGTANACATSTRLSVTGTVPATTTNILIILTSTGTGAISDAHQIDSVLLEESATVNTYFDGSTNADTSWTGTVNNSTSIYSVNMYVDSALFERSSTIKDYFDGSTAGGSWSGTADNSSSIITAGGSDYQVGSNITIPGASLGGTTPANNLTLTIATKADGLYVSGGSAINEANAHNIDGFTVFLRTSTSTDSTSITTSDLNNNIQQVYLTAEKRSHTFSGISPSSFYKAAVRAYRVVDSDIAPAGVIYGPLLNTTQRTATDPKIGGSNGIVIGNGQIYIGAGNYGNADTGFYADATPRFSLGEKLTWAGSTLTVTGAINATSGTFNNTITVGTHATTKINIVGTSATTTTAIYSGTTGYGTGTGFWMDASGRFSLGANLTWSGGTLSINGGGTFTGALSGGTISIGSGNSIFKADSNGIYLGDAIFADAEFSVSPAGYLKSKSGEIGGWTIGSVTGTANGAQTVFPGSIYQWKTVAGVATLSLMSPDGFAWFSGGLVAPTISGFSTGVTTNGGALNTMILRNIKYGGARPTDGAIGDIFLS